MASSCKGRWLRAVASSLSDSILQAQRRLCVVQLLPHPLSQRTNCQPQGASRFQGFFQLESLIWCKMNKLRPVSVENYAEATHFDSSVDTPFTSAPDAASFTWNNKRSYVTTTSDEQSQNLAIGKATSTNYFACTIDTGNSGNGIFIWCSLH